MSRAAGTAVHRDRLGGEHRERAAGPHHGEPRMLRETGALELAWRDPADRDRLAREALAQRNPIIDSELWTWVVREADARAVVLWTNPVFDHADVPNAELSRLADSDLWTITLRLPRSLRASYRIGVHRGDGPPPWRDAEGRRATILAAMAAGEPDARGAATIEPRAGERSSVAAGPDAVAEPWRGLAAGAAGSLHPLELPDGERAQLYAPAAVDGPTPLLVLFDGEAWRALGLPRILDTLIADGALPPLHVAMLDAGEHRWERLGVPGGHVDTVLDHLLPAVRAGWPVDPSGEATIVSGQSLGGIAALWALALGGGAVRHAIAQSPSLWRFEVSGPLLATSGWDSARLQAGSFEGDMLELSHGLHARLRDGGRDARLDALEAGHDWAVWRVNLVTALLEHFGGHVAGQSKTPAM